jgi:hypothetical protein
MVPAAVGGAVAVFALAGALELVALVELLVALLLVLEVLELPHAVRPSTSTAKPRIAPILFVVTRSPSLDCLFVCQQGKRTRLPTPCRPSLLIASLPDVKIS